ncbi:MAG: putative toxin-antitoxin system toxin component, PIN family [Bacillota bacterium]
MVDTNVLMGGLINPVKASGRVLNLWLDGKVDVLLSPAVRDEYVCIFNKMRFGSQEAVGRRERAMQKLLRQENLMLVEPDFRLRVIEEDPSDNRLLECAVSGRADYIVSQDKHLLRVREYAGIKILTAQAFLLRECPESRNQE